MLLIPLADIRKRLLWWWVAVTVLLLAFFFLLAVNGKFVEIEGTAWLWLGVNVIPGLLVLLLGSIQNKNSGKLIQVSVYRVIFVATIVYLVLLLGSFWAMAMGAGGQSIDQFFRSSYRWLVPIQLLLVLVFGVLYYKKETLFQPNEKILKKHLAEKAAQAKSSNNVAQEEAFEKLASGDYAGLFGSLREKFQQHPENKSTFNELILLESQYGEWKRQKEYDLADPGEARRTLNRITMALITMVSDMDNK